MMRATVVASYDMLATAPFCHLLAGDLWSGPEAVRVAPQHLPRLGVNEASLRAARAQGEEMRSGRALTQTRRGLSSGPDETPYSRRHSSSFSSIRSLPVGVLVSIPKLRMRSATSFALRRPM